MLALRHILIVAFGLALCAWFPPEISAQDSPVIRPQGDPRDDVFEDDPADVLPRGPKAPPPRHTVWGFLGSIPNDLFDGSGWESVFAGAGYHFAVFPEQYLGIGIYYQTRIESKIVLHPLRPRFYLQVEETRRDLAYVNIEKSFFLLADRWGLYGAMGYGYSGGNYRGTSATAPFGWTPVFEGGAVVQFTDQRPGWRARLGYQYADRVTSGSDMIALQVGVTF